MRLALGLLVVAMLSLSQGACSAGCDDRGDRNATVQLLDASTGEPICDATVTVQQTGEVIQAAPLDDGRCTGLVSVGGPGQDHTVTINATGYKSRIVEVPSVRRGCHHDGGELAVELDPNP